MHTFLSRLGLVQRIALLCGGLCLLATMLLVLVSNLSSAHILQQQLQTQGADLARLIASNAAKNLDEGDLLSLEVGLKQALKQHQLQHISVYNVESREIGAAGNRGRSSELVFSAPLRIDGDIAGELSIELPEARWLQDYQRMSMGLFFLALLLSVFVAAVCAALAQRPARRLREATELLRPVAGALDAANTDELSQLENYLEQLPIELLKPPVPAGNSLAEYDSASVLYLRLNSLSGYVETLDESSLLRYTEFQRKLVALCGQLYGAELAVVRQFGLLLSFSGSHTAGSPALRACSTAWLIQAMIKNLQGHLRLQLNLSMAVAVSEAGIGSSADIYPGLYSQHIIDELAGIVEEEPEAILLAPGPCEDLGVQQHCLLGPVDSRHYHELAGFDEPHAKLLEGQLLLLREKLGA